jgi:hypothetical protein
MMDNVIGTLIYRITGDTSALDAGLDRSRARIVQTGTSIEALGVKLRKVSTAVISGVFVKSLLDASSRVEELDSKFRTVFSGMEAEADAWARVYADVTNRGVTATKEFLATQQDLRTGYGDTTEQAARYSQAVVGITNDLASFSNVPVEEAMASMQSGLSFQFEALRRLGVSLSVETINQGEYAKSIRKTWLEMSNLEKQEAVLSGVVSQSKNALHQEIKLWQDYDYTIGDAALTADSFANTSQGLRQTLDDLASELGDALLPAATGILGLALDGARAFNGWSDTAQTLAFSLGALAAVALAVGGPWGAVLGVVAGATVLVTSHKGATERLTSATNDLSAASNEYAGLTRQLAGDTSDLTDSELGLLKARQALLGLEAQKNLAEVMKSYDETSKKIQKHEKAVESAQARQEAYALAAAKGPAAVRAEIERLERQASKSSSERTYYDTLKEAQMQFFMNSSNYMEIWKDKLNAAVDDLIQGQGDLAGAEAALKEAVLATAIAVNTEAVNVDYLAQTYPELYGQIMSTAAAIKVDTDATNNNASATNTAANASRNWSNRLKEQKAALAEQSGDYQMATALRLTLSRIEKEAAIRKIATDAKLVQEGENVNDLSINLLRNRIQQDGTSYTELQALDEWYANEKKRITQDGAESEEELAQRLAASIRDQEASRQQAVASEQESAGHVEAAYLIRLQVLQDSRAAERAILAQKVADKKATQDELDTFDKVTAAQEVALEDEKDRKLTAARKETADELRNASLQQQVSMMQNAASELESLNQTEAAYDLRLEALRAQRAAERAELEKKVADNRATADDLVAYDRITAGQEVELENEKNRKLTAARKTSAEAMKQASLQQSNAVKEALASELEAEGYIEAAYQKRVEVLQSSRAAERIELERKVADNRATADDLVAYDRITAEQEIEIEREKNRKLSDARKQSAKEMKDMLAGQRSELMGRKAEELEQAGSFRAATDIRLDLLRHERDEAIDAMKRKLANHTATQKEMDDLNAYYAAKETRLHKEQTGKIKDFWMDMFDQVSGFAKELTSGLGDLWSAQTDARIAEIDRQTQAQLEALGLQEESEAEKLRKEYAEAVKTGDMKTARGKADAMERLRIEEEADEKKKKLQREQAERERDIKVFQALLDTAAAVIRFMADPGGWTGVALSAMAAVTGGVQVAAIQSQPLPSFAVGIAEVPEDMVARIHQGEMVVPKTYAQSVRDGDVSIGGAGGAANVTVTVINNTGAEVSTSRDEDGDTARYTILIGRTVDRQLRDGRYDGAMRQRYDIREAGRNG